MSKTMPADRWIADFRDRHEQLMNYIAGLSEAELEFAPEGRWSAIQQLRHVYLCLKTIRQALSSAAYIEASFGRIDRHPMSFDEVIARYRSGLDQGGKAPERFEPGAVDATQRAAEIAALQEVVQGIEQQLAIYAPADLDSLLLPHPFVGKLTIREFIFLMTEHASIHERSIRKQLGPAREPGSI